MMPTHTDPARAPRTPAETAALVVAASLMVVGGSLQVGGCSLGWFSRDDGSGVVAQDHPLDEPARISASLSALTAQDADVASGGAAGTDFTPTGPYAPGLEGSGSIAGDLESPSVGDLIAQSALNLDELLGERSQSGSTERVLQEPEADAEIRPAALALAEELTGSPQMMGPPEPSIEDFAATPPVEGSGEGDASRLSEARAQWRSLLESKPVDDAARDAIELAVAEVLDPTAPHGQWMDDPALTEALTPEQVVVVEQMQTLLKEVIESDAEPGDAASALAVAIDALHDEEPLRIARAELCAAVQGFGKYERLGSFAAGQAHRAILYIQLEQFSHRSIESLERGSIAGADDEWMVELSQSVTLWFDGRQQWHRPMRTVTDASREKRRDFYLLREIELPAGLRIGTHDLRVTVRDETSGQIAEALVPVEIVAAGLAAR